MRSARLLTLIALSIVLLSSIPCAADVQPVTSIAGAKLAADGTPVSVTSAVVTATSSTLFYIEANDRSSGICVHLDGNTIRGIDKRADVTGTVQTDEDGERYVQATTAVQNGTGTLTPIALRNKDLGGSALLSEIPGGGQRGVPDGVGLNNIGLFVRIRGKVTYGGAGFFYIDDGAGLHDGSGYTGVRVVGGVPLCDGMDPVGWYVEVTGISSISRAGDDVCRCVLSVGTSLLNIVETGSGLQYADLRKGTGAAAEFGSNVAVHYTLWTTDCWEVDSSRYSGQPFEFTVGYAQTIPGFQEGVMGMKVGGKRFLIIPPELGYGEDGTDTIPPNSTLLFEVELVSVQ